MRILRLRFSIFCLVVLAVICVPTTKVSLANICAEQNAVYSFYTDDVSNVNKQTKIVQNGKYYIVSVSAKNASGVKKSLKNLFGESLRIKNYTKKQIEQIFCHFSNKQITTEQIDKTQILYFYDESLSHFVIQNGKKVNIQIALTDQCVTIGYPLILGSF